ncbi:MAG: hypothetical protein J5711_01010 [Bacteroidales bacterium]|nr:hypothetical protein [Bacteroidales bacterium]
MSDIVANYQKIIEIMTESQFRDFVLLYHKEYYAPCEVTIVDGPYDGGQDIEIRKQHRVLKCQIQVTVQEKNIETKIMSDVRKAFLNCEQYDHLDTLYFFVNHPISNSVQMRIRKQAQAEGINLQIQDSKFMAERSSEYSSLRDFLSNILDVSLPKSDTIDSKVQIVYEAVSQQSGIKAIKEELIKTFFLKVLYDKGEATVAEISAELDDVFMNVVKHHYYETLAGKLNGVYIEQIPDTKPKRYTLLPEAKEYVTSVYLSEKTKILELRNRYETVSKENGVSISFDNIYPYIEQLYDDNCNPENGMFSDVVEEHLNQLTNYVKENINVTSGEIDKITTQLLSVFDINDYTGKQSATKMLINLFKDNQIDGYLAQKNRSLLFDTPVLIQYLCYLFKDLEDYKYQPFQNVRTLIKTIEDPRLNVTTFTLEGYFKEMVSHLSSAILIGRYLEVPEIRELGKSKNSFYNFYIEVSSREEVGGMDEFIESVLDIDELPDSRNKLESILEQKLREQLEILGLREERRYEIENWQEYKKEYDYALLNTSGERKSNTARINDLNAIIYLSYVPFDSDYYLVTWDATFDKARTELKIRHSDMSDWYLYSPQQLSGTFSLLNFKINPTFITSNILSLIDGSLASNLDAKSFVDTVIEFLQGSSDSKMKVAKNLAKLRKSLYRAEVTGYEAEDEKPIDDLLTDILDYTIKDEQKYELFVQIMQSEECIKGIADILEKNLVLWEQGNYNKDTLNKGVEDYLNGFERT